MNGTNSMMGIPLESELTTAPNLHHGDALNLRLLSRFLKSRNGLAANAKDATYFSYKPAKAAFRGFWLKKVAVFGLPSALCNMQYFQYLKPVPGRLEALRRERAQAFLV